MLHDLVHYATRWCDDVFIHLWHRKRLFLSGDMGNIGFFNKSVCKKICDDVYYDISQCVIPRIATTTEIKNLTLKNKTKCG